MTDRVRNRPGSPLATRLAETERLIKQNGLAQAIPTTPEDGAVTTSGNRYFWVETERRKRGGAAKLTGDATLFGGLGKQFLDTGRLLPKYSQAVPVDAAGRRFRNLLDSESGFSYLRQVATQAPEISVLDPEAPGRAAHRMVPRGGWLGTVSRSNFVADHPRTLGRVLKDRVKDYGGAVKTFTKAQGSIRNHLMSDEGLMRVSTGAMLGLNALMLPTAVANVADALRDGPEGLIETQSGRTGALQSVGLAVTGAAMLQARSWSRQRLAEQMAEGTRRLPKTPLGRASWVARNSLAAPVWLKPWVVRGGLISGAFTAINELDDKQVKVPTPFGKVKVLPDVGLSTRDHRENTVKLVGGLTATGLLAKSLSSVRIAGTAQGFLPKLGAMLTSPHMRHWGWRLGLPIAAIGAANAVGLLDVMNEKRPARRRVDAAPDGQPAEPSRGPR